MMAELVWVRDAAGGRLSPCQLPRGSLVRDLLPVSSSGRPWRDFYVKCNGRRVGAEEELRNGVVYSVEPRLCGGKGGFGSMLRALGAQIEKTTNREACRDLSGRRLRDVNHEKAMAEWIKKQADREAEKEQRRIEKLKRKLAEPKHYFNDPEYDRQCSDMSERMEDAVIQGLQAASSREVSADSGDSRKRRKDPGSSKGQSDKKKCLWSGVEGLDVSSSSSDSGSDSDSESPCTSASCGNTVSGLHSSESSSDGAAHGSFVAAPIEQSPEQMEAESSMQGFRDMEDQPTCSSGAPAVTPEAGAPAVTPEAGAPAVTPEAGAPAVTPEAGAPAVTPEAGAPAVTPEAGAPAVTPEAGAPAVTPEAGAPAVTPEAGAPAVTPEAGAPAVTPEAGAPAVTPEAGAPAVTPEAGAPAVTPEADHPAVTPSHEPAVTPEPDQSSVNPEAQLKTPHTDSSPFDLLAFTSAAELEALGLDKLKLELLALGLKCGGTLQERAARLFSVRGLSREQMDPGLFPKPSKGKKR